MKAKSFTLIFLLALCLVFPVQHFAISQEEESLPEQATVENQDESMDDIDAGIMDMEAVPDEALEEPELVNEAEEPAPIEGSTESAMQINAVTTYYVDANSPCTASTCAGTTWATANRQLFDALAKAVSGDFILVADGTYKPGHWSLKGLLHYQTDSFNLKAGVQVYGGYAGYGAANPNERNLTKYQSILSGNIGDQTMNTDNCYHVVSALQLSPAPVLDGFIIEEGFAGVAGSWRDYGGGMLVISTSPTIANCIFRNNYAATNGGAINFHYEAAAPTQNFSNIYQCVFQNNQSGLLGGAISLGDSEKDAGNPYIFQSTFSANSSARGGAIWLGYAEKPDIRNCIFWGNTATTAGAEIGLDHSSLYIEYTDLEGGTAGIYKNAGTETIYPTQVTDINPLFTTGLKLSLTSPCIDAGRNQNAPYSLDLGSQTRRTDFVDIPDSGFNLDTPPIVDLGAYEAQPPAAPTAAPSNLTVTPTCACDMYLSWTDNSPDETKFIIESRSCSREYPPICGPWAFNKNVPGKTGTGSTVSTYDTSIPTCTIFSKSYQYRVYAQNGGGNSGYSNIDAAIPATQAPAAPTNLRVQAGCGWICLYWNDNSNNETEFQLEQSTNPNFTEGYIFSKPLADTTLISYGNIPAGVYYYRIRARNSICNVNSDYSNIVNINAAGGVIPNAPTNLNVTAVCGGKMNLTWSNNSNNEFYFNIYRSTSPSSGFLWNGTVNPGVTTHSDSGLTPGTPYYYKVAAVGGCGMTYSNTVGRVALSGVPTAPTGLSATAFSSTEINLSWTDASSDETGFKIERAPDVSGSPGTFAQIYIQEANATTYRDTGLTANTKYWYRVRATNACGDSTYSNSEPATTTGGNPTPLSAPLLVANLDADPRMDLVVNFGSPWGLWVFYNNTTWAQIHGTSPGALAVGNIDGAGGDDIVCTFGAYGTWVFYNNATWTQINGTAAGALAVGNIDGAGGNDIACSFGASGTWVFYNNTTWAQINGTAAGALAVGNIDGAGGNDIACTFGAYGTWVFYNNATWTQINGTAAGALAVGNIDGAGGNDIACSFGASGTWVFYNNTTWAQINGTAAGALAVGNIDGAGGNDIACTFGASGTWVFYNKLPGHRSMAQQLAL